MRTIFLTILTMIAFAGNSIFARLGLVGQNAIDATIDPANYSLIRLISGTLMLTILVSIQKSSPGTILKSGNWISAISLLGYALAFSFAYVALETGIGALILFACVQGTMIIWAIFKGDRPSLLEWIGLVTAFGAFVWLVSPGLSAPDPMAAMLMVISGISWGIYSIKGKNISNPLLETTGNFTKATLLALAFLLISTTQTQLTMLGVIMAVCSGAITSALGYALWYNLLRKITQTNAAIVQLTVPVIAGIGGTIFLSEPWTTRFAISSLLILGGVCIATLAKTKRS